jgi:hypothetical protein
MEALMFAATGPGDLSPTAIFIRGILITITSLAVFAGSVWLLLGTNVGFRKAMLIVLACLFGFVVMLSLLWMRYPGLSPRPAGPVCLFGQINPAYVDPGPDAAADAAQAEPPAGALQQAGEGEEAEVKPCLTGIDITRYFYAAIFMTSSAALTAACMWGLSRLEEIESEAAAAHKDESPVAGR